MTLAKDALHFLPLGGSGEIGMNLNLYGLDGKWLMVDLGITFAEESLPGIDLILPDPSFIRERRNDLLGLVLTHAHEDHLGAVPYLWSQLECPIYATRFTAAVLRSKLQENGLVERVKVHEVEACTPFELGPFSVELINVTHSIPESSILALRTRAGTVVHTGDWKLDPTPLLGPASNTEALSQLGQQGVDALICDSTNALEQGHSGSEAEVRESLTRLFGRLQNRIAVTCFASNVARIESVAAAARANGRETALVGRSLWRINEAARTTGYLKDTPDFLSEYEVALLPRDKVVLVCTGSQGEPRSALARMAAQDHPQVSLERGDAVIFSSRMIPGNEKAIGHVQNQLVRHGMKVITDEDEFVHVSGHPARDELVRMYQWLRPKLSIPVHGERRHQEAHAELAESCQVPQVIIPENGSLIRLTGGRPAVVDEVPVGRLVVDGKRIIPLDDGAIRNRQRIVTNGAVVVTLAVTGRGDLAGAPQVSALGLFDRDNDRNALLDLVDAVREAVGSLPRQLRQDDDEAIRQAVRTVTRRSFKLSHGKRPVTEVHLVRV